MNILALLFAGVLSFSAYSENGQKVQEGTETVYKGEVVEILHAKPKTGDDGGVTLRMKTSPKDTLDVRLGPKWFLDRNKANFQPGEKVTVIGLTFSADREKTVHARQIKDDDTEIILRRHDGKPFWPQKENSKKVDLQEKRKSGE